MDSNYLLGTAYVAKLGEDWNPKAPFAEFDELTPDEPGRVQQLVGHVLNVTARVLKQRPTLSQQTCNTLPDDDQTGMVLE